MKDYELDKKKKGQFILNYEEKGNKIIVNYANGDKISIPYTEENIEILDKNMREQVEKSAICYKSRKNDCLGYSFLTMLSLFIASFTFKPIFFGIAGEMFFSKLLFVCSSFCVLVGTMCIISAAKTIYDIKKNKRFLELENTVNEKVKENENMLYNTHKVTKNIVKKSDENRVTFTINNIDKVPFSDLEQIISNIEREEKYNFEYPVVLEEEKTKKKTK